MNSSFGGDYAVKPYWHESRRAINYASILAKMPLLLVHGEKDVLVSMQQSENLLEAIKKSGGEQVELIKVPNIGHNNNIVIGLEDRIFEFIEKAEK